MFNVQCSKLCTEVVKEKRLELEINGRSSNKRSHGFWVKTKNCYEVWKLGKKKYGYLRRMVEVPKKKNHGFWVKI